MDKIEQYIINACVANDPSIMELKFGCRFIAKKEFVEGASTGIVVSQDFSFIDCTGGHREIKTELIYYKKELFEILGRDIYLHDVLGAIENTLQNYGEMGRSRTFIYERFLEVIREWNLKKPLHKQEEETKLLLAHIFGFKE